jgi:Domain of unknown function (DUF4124)
MMRILLFTLIFLASSLALGATVYKWVDENGTVHYSDQPHPNAQKVQVQEAQTYPSSQTPSQAAAAANAQQQGTSPDAARVSYRGCVISSPQDGAALANPDSLNVSVRTDPGVQPGDQVFILLDGAALNGGNPTGSQFTISPVDRGTHTLQAVVRDASGNLMCQTPGITVDVHQNSILNPNNPQNGHVAPH